ncbi:MAG TPA: guanylate kinase [Caulobacteraceae bacterium]
MSSERRRRGLMLVISSPSGAGKTTLCRKLVADHAELELSVSMTTRAARPGEENGREYHFVDRSAFDALREKDAFLEWAEVHEHCYGTPRDPVMAALEAGRDVLFDIDWQGAQSITNVAAADVVRVFILPPSMGELSRRLHTRAQDSEAVISRRLKRAPGEIEHWFEYDYVLVNEDYDQTYSDLLHIYHAERLKKDRNPWIRPFVTRLLAEPLD